MRKMLLAGVFAATLFVVGIPVAGAAQELPDGCTKDRGTVTCTTFEGPGKNQAGVGNETTDETKGNTTNKNPEPQDLKDEECEQNPTSSQGKPIKCA
jgi:hypothetical protein